MLSIQKNTHAVLHMLLMYEENSKLYTIVTPFDFRANYYSMLPMGTKISPDDAQSQTEEVLRGIGKN